MDWDLSVSLYTFESYAPHSWRLDLFRCIHYYYYYERERPALAADDNFPYTRQYAASIVRTLLCLFYSWDFLLDADFHASQKSWFYLLNKFLDKKKPKKRNYQPSNVTANSRRRSHSSHWIYRIKYFTVYRLPSRNRFIVSLPNDMYDIVLCIIKSLEVPKSWFAAAQCRKSIFIGWTKKMSLLKFRFDRALTGANKPTKIKSIIFQMPHLKTWIIIIVCCVCGNHISFAPNNRDRNMFRLPIGLFRTYALMLNKEKKKRKLGIFDGAVSTKIYLFIWLRKIQLKMEKIAQFEVSENQNGVLLGAALSRTQSSLTIINSKHL